jgi:hypothetical protein
MKKVTVTKDDSHWACMQAARAMREALDFRSSGVSGGPWLGDGPQILNSTSPTPR